MTSPENDNREIPPQLETEKSTGIDQGYFLRLCQPYLPTEGTLLRKRQPFTRDVKVLLPSEKELKPLPFRPRPIITLMKDLPAQKEDVQKETHAPVRSYADMSIFSQVHRSQKLPSQLQKRTPLRYHLTTTSTQGLLKQKPTSKQQLLKERLVLAHPIVPRCCGSVKMEKPQLIDVNRVIFVLNVYSTFLILLK